VKVVAGIDLGGTAINYTFMDADERFLVEDLCEHPARSWEGPPVCLEQIAVGLEMAAARAGIALNDIALIGLDTPGPAGPTGVLSARGSTNFVHADWAGFDVRGAVQGRLQRPVIYLNDGNAAALWGHFKLFGSSKSATSVAAIVGTGLGGGVIVESRFITGRVGFGGELGHVLIPYQTIPGIDGLHPVCNCGRTGDLESICSLTGISRALLPYFLKRFPDHELAAMDDIRQAARRVRPLAEQGDPMAREIFRVQANALGLLFDEMVNTFDPDALIVGGGMIEVGPEFQRWIIDQIRAGMPEQRIEQADIPITVIPNGDTAGARGAAIEALRVARQASLI
jgi:predicted NBD/HSP70 family sugar kinase